VPGMETMNGLATDRPLLQGGRWNKSFVAPGLSSFCHQATRDWRRFVATTHRSDAYSLCAPPENPSRDDVLFASRYKTTHVK
jgi:hypothetical protein